MDERSLICAWIRHYIAGLEALSGGHGCAPDARTQIELDTARSILWAVESGDYLTDLSGPVRH